MELEDLLCDGLLEWLRDDEPGFSGDVDLEQLLAAASDVYEQSTDPTPSDSALPACASGSTQSSLVSSTLSPIYIIISCKCIMTKVLYTAFVTFGYIHHINKICGSYPGGISIESTERGLYDI